MGLLEYAKQRIFNRGEALRGSLRDERFMRSLGAKSLDEAWALLADGAGDGWLGFENPALLWERAKSTKCKTADRQKAVDMLVLIGEGDEHATIAWLSKEGMGFMRAQWMANCLLAAIHSGQEAVAHELAQHAFNNHTLSLFGGVQRVGLLPKFKRDARAMAEKSSHHRHGGAVVFQEWTPLVAAIAAGQNSVADFLIAKSSWLAPSAEIVATLEPALGGDAQEDLRSDEARVLSFAISRRRESTQLALIQRLVGNGKGPRGALASGEMLRLAASHGQEEAAFQLMAARAHACKTLEESDADLSRMEPQILRMMIDGGMSRAAKKLVRMAAARPRPFGIEMLDKPDALGLTALGAAIEKKDEAVAIMLVAAGADPRAPSGGECMAIRAAKLGLEDAARAILDRLGHNSFFDGSVKESDGAFLAFDAIGCGWDEAVIVLIKAGCSLRSRADANGQSPGPLSWPVAASDLISMAVIGRLAGMSPADRAWALEYVSIHGQLAFGPLAKALCYGSPTVAKALIQAGASIENAVGQVKFEMPELVSRLNHFIEEIACLPHKTAGARSDTDASLRLAKKAADARERAAAMPVGRGDAHRASRRASP